MYATNSLILFRLLELSGNTSRSQVLSRTLSLSLSLANEVGGNRVRTGHGKRGKPWNLSSSFSRPEKSLKIKVLFDRLVTSSDKTRAM